MATAGLRTVLDDTNSAGIAPSGLLPDPLATSTSTDTDSNVAPSQSGNNNFIYIYSFLSTLFLLLCISLVILVRVLLRRRRLEALLNQADSGAGNDPDAANVTAHTSAMQQRESRRNRRRKKHQLLGSKPYLSSAWIGSGPLPTSISTEALLGSIQPFSASLAPPLEEEEAHVNGEKQQHQASYQHHQRQQASIPLVDLYSAPQSHLLPEDATTHSTSNSISNTNTANKSRLLQLLALPKSVSISSCTVEEAPSSSSADRPGLLALSTLNSINPSDPSPSSPIPLTPLTNLQPNQFPLSPSPLPPSPSPITPTTTAGGNNLDRVQVEFLIAMPRAPSLRRPRFGNQSTTSFGCPSIFTESESACGGDARSIGADSSWSCLQDGELPELVVGVSTVQVPMTERGGLDRYTIARRAAMRSERR